MTGNHLTVCLIQAPGRINGILEEWTRSGLVRNVVTCETGMFRDVGLDVSCSYFDSDNAQIESEDDVRVVDVSLKDVIGSQPRDTMVTLVAFHEHMSTSSGSTSLPDTGVLNGHMRRMGESVTVRLFTVSAYDRLSSRDAFPTGWDMHLVHDSSSLALPTIHHEVDTTDVPHLCAVLALCAGGGWSFSEGVTPGPTERDRASSVGQAGLFRIVRPEIRIVTANSRDAEIAEVTRTSLARSSPWPRPPESTVISANIPVPAATVQELADACDFYVDKNLQNDRFTKHRPRSALRFMNPVSAWWRLRRGYAVVKREDADRVTDVFHAAARLKKLPIHNLDDAIWSIREAGMPEFELGMTTSALAGGPWHKIRELCFGLVDGGDPPQGVQDVSVPLGTESGLRSVWSAPSALAPALGASDEFTFEHRSGHRVADITGVNKIESLDALHYQRVDTIVRHKEDPFPYITDSDRPDLQKEIADNEELRRSWSQLQTDWSNWKARSKRGRLSPLGQLSTVLGKAADAAYDNFTEAVKTSPSDRYIVTQYSFSRVNLLTFWTAFIIGAIACVLCFLIGGSPLPGGNAVMYTMLALWLALLVALLLLYLSSRKLDDKFELMSIDDLECAQSTLHYAYEVTRLHDLGHAFRHHQRVVRVMLHTPFGTEDVDTQNSVFAIAQSAASGTDFGAPSIVSGDARMSERQKEEMRSLLNERMFRQKWLTGVYNEVFDIWHQQYADIIGSTDFDSPDDDYWPTGEVFRTVEGRALMGPREEFSDAVAQADNVRIEAREQLVRRLMDAARDDVAQIDQIESISADRYRAFSGSARDFLEFSDMPTSRCRFDAPIFERAREAQVNVDSTILVVYDEPIRNQRDDRTMFASWRLLMSAPYEADRLLHAVEADNPDYNRHLTDDTGDSFDAPPSV